MTGELESRYRRLIGLYPPGHRAVYAEDMLNVLIESALPGQRRPDLRTGLDLLKGAAQAWALRARTRLGAWQRVGAPPAIALLALLILLPQSVTTAVWMVAGMTMTPYTGWLAVAVQLPDLIWLPVTAAAVLGLRRCAVWAALVVGIVWPLLNTAVGVSGWAASFLGEPGRLPWLPVALIAVAGLWVDPGAHRGIQQLGRGSAVAFAGVLLIGVGRADLPALVGGRLLWADPWGMLALGVGLALVALTCITVAVRANRSRLLATALAVLVPVLLASVYAGSDPIPWSWHFQRQVQIALPVTLLICSLILSRALVTATARSARSGNDEQPSPTPPLPG